MTTPVEKMSQSLSPANINQEAMPLSQQLAVRTDTLEVVKKMNKQFQVNNAREMLAMDAMAKISSLSLLEVELAVQNPHAAENLAIITRAFTYLSAQDLV
ncbi:hypothetical protein GTI81_07650 [Enterococcus faecalis]|uniref:Uncharacterized protein n=1 Tax=Enterococcus faecalis TaxID=1351 RepID=A0AAP6RGL1_ENTFL|nr:hypothetical protein [Enterococcus faecalis]MXS29381.1 hypothetical protein [Enterococcus faecalis]MXS52582.1 hypothetical protein [Enterococcus faecalis]